MLRLFSPWRSKYIETFFHSNDDDNVCVLCKAHTDNSDEDHLIAFRSKHCYAILNKYPYNSGHLMVVPFRHTGLFSDLTDDELLDVMSVLKKLSEALGLILRPDGFNIGSNIGRTAGAGIEQHIHFHIVPRWNGDTNFMPVLADTKVISEDTKETWVKLSSHLK